MKLLTIMTSQIDARLFTDHLKAHGLKVVMSGNKEYASIITGQDNGRFEILVTEDDFDKAQKLSRELNVQIVNQAKSTHATWESYYKKSIIFALISLFILPVIFNMASIYNLYKFIKSPKQMSKSTYLILTLVSIIINITFALAGLFLLYKTFS